MIPNEPPRNPSTGFLFFPPYRVQGYSIAGEETYVQIPELDVCFDVGRAQRLALTSNYIALSHGHMDHSAGLAYYLSQRQFQGMGTGTVLCHPSLVGSIKTLMNAWVDIEQQKTPYEVVGMDPEGESAEFEIKPSIFLRAFKTPHTSNSLGFSVVEKRSKLKEELLGLPQEKLVEIKKSGQEITYIREVPICAYMGDTAPGEHFMREDVKNAPILITECTFLEDDHKSRARVGNHLHISDLADLLPEMNNENVVLMHMSRRTHLGEARKQLQKVLPEDVAARVHILMDRRTNRARYQKQLDEYADNAPEGAEAIAD
ncbi:MAG: MBL fold metallo-hydrolase [Planctomycetota bacterium]|jgi:ribonuclease Z